MVKSRSQSIKVATAHAHQHEVLSVGQRFSNSDFGVIQPIHHNSPYMFFEARSACLWTADAVFECEVGL